MEIVSGRIHEIRPSGMMIIVAQMPEWKDMAICGNVVEIGIPDGRLITPEQRKHAYALMRDISDWMGEMEMDTVKDLMKFKFMVEEMKAIERRIFSLADCDMTTAREFIDFLIRFIVANDIPARTSLTECCGDIERYVYECLMHRVCAVCGKPADLHHVDAIGAGRDRDAVYQIGMGVLPLCRIHHTECHKIGRETFTDKYHLQPIPLTPAIGKRYALTIANLGGHHGTKMD